MSYKVPADLIKTICNHLIDKYLPPKKRRHKTDAAFNDKDIAFFSAGTATLSYAFTRERGSLPKNYLNRAEFRAGYILYFTVTNYLKALFCLEEIGAKNRFKGDVNVLDIGTGPGTALIASADYFTPPHPTLSPKGRGVTLTGIDQNANILKDANALIRSYAGGRVNLKTTAATISIRNLNAILIGGRYQIIFLENIISELHRHESSMLVNALLEKHLTTDGVLIIIEPALRKTTRDLMELRDSVLAHNRSPLRVSSPCLHDLPCPMLNANRRDWCHMYLNWDRPPLIEKIDRIINNKKDYLKFSYLILSKGGAPTGTNEVVKEDLWRVVSAPLISNGKIELLICNQTGLKRLVRLDRDKSFTNGQLDHLQRGDMVQYNGPLKMTRQSVIKKLTRTY